MLISVIVIIALLFLVINICLALKKESAKYHALNMSRKRAMAGDAASKVLHAKCLSKTAKTEIGSALTQK